MSESKELTPLKDSKLKSGLVFLSWNIVTDCNSECCLYEKCDSKTDERCKVEEEYLNHIIKPVFKYLENDLDEYDLVELGFKYIRLHHNLVRVQKEILATKIIIRSLKGGIMVNPLLAEERALLQAIEALDINKLLRRRVKVRVNAITAGLQLGKDGKKTEVVEVLDESNTEYTDKLAGDQ